jgi:hypothetical protein
MIPEKIFARTATQKLQMQGPAPHGVQGKARSLFSLFSLSGLFGLFGLSGASSKNQTNQINQTNQTDKIDQNAADGLFSKSSIMA